MINMMQGDCMELMASKPDNFYKLAIVDPPYGIGVSEKNSSNDKQSKKSATNSNMYGLQRWDDNIPSDRYFKELFRVSKKQIIWGINYFNSLIGSGRLFWDKVVTMPTYSRGELAYLSFKNSMDYFKFIWHGMLQEDMKNKQKRIHPTEKPIQLYKWLLQNYAKPGDKILDTHGGSGSICIACHDMGFDIDWIELDEDYYNSAKKRFKEHTDNLKREF